MQHEKKLTKLILMRPLLTLNSLNWEIFLFLFSSYKVHVLQVNKGFTFISCQSNFKSNIKFYEADINLAQKNFKTTNTLRSLTKILTHEKEKKKPRT